MFLEEWPVLNAENVGIEQNDGQTYFLWRNVFGSVNLLRILNKLTKNKHSRTMMLVVFKSTPILKRILKLRSVSVCTPKDHLTFPGDLSILHSEATQNAGSLFGKTVEKNQHGRNFGYLHEIETQASFQVSNDRLPPPLG